MARFAFVLLAAFLALATTTTANPAPQAPASTTLPPQVCTQCVSSPNNCDITAPCSNFLGKLYCGCRPGYKATGLANNDVRQFRIDTVSGQAFRVWVVPGVICNTLCNQPFGANPCSEVVVRDQCAP